MPQNPYAQFKANPYAVYSTPGTGPKAPTGFAAPGASAVAPIPGGPDSPEHVAAVERARAAAAVSVNNPAEIAKALAIEAIRLEGKRREQEMMAGAATLPASLDRVTGPDFLKMIPPQTGAMVQALTDGRMAFPAGAAMRSPYWQQMLAYVAHYDPSFDAVNFNARQKTRVDFTSGQSSRNIKSLNTAIGHLGQLNDQIGGTASHGGFPLATTVNQVQNAFMRGEGKSGPTLFDQTSGALASELTQVFRGSGGAEADVKRYLSELSPNASLEQKQAAVKNIAGLLQSRLEAVGDQYRQGMGKTIDPLQLLNPHAQKAFGAILGPGTGGDGGPPPPKAAPPVIPMGPPPGATPASGATHAADMDQKTAGFINSVVKNSATVDDANRILVAAGVVGPEGMNPEQFNNARKIIQSGGTPMPQYEKPSSLATKAINSPVGTFVGSAVDADMAGLSDEMKAGVDWAGNGFQGGYGNFLDAADAAKQANFAGNRKSSFAGQLAGNIGGTMLTGGLLKGVGLTAKLGKAANYIGATGFGGAEGFGQNNDNRTLGAGAGALAAGAGYPIGEAASIPFNAALRTRPGMAFSNGARNFAAKIPGSKFAIDTAPTTYAPGLSPAENMAAGVFNKVGPDAIKGQLDEAGKFGLPMTIADTAPEARELVGSAVRRSPTAASHAEGVLLPRGRGQIDRFGGAVERYLGPVDNVPQLSQDLVKKAKTDAGPLYKEAFEGGSVAPLEHQFEQAFQQSSANVASAKRAVADAQHRLTQTKAGVSRAGENVYAASSALRGDRDVTASLGQAQEGLAAAEREHAANLARLRQAQEDGSSGRPGAIWSPRIQQFLDDPISQAGLARGIEVQRLEALADGKPFNHTELAVTGFDESGAPKVAAVPNMRTMDAVNRGFGEILDSYPRGPNGKPILDQRGRAVDQVRRALLKELDSINGKYGAARAAYGGPMQSRDALDFGNRAVAMKPETMGLGLAENSSEQLAQAQLGFRSGLMDQANKVRYASNPFDATLGSPAAEQRLTTMFGNNSGVANLLRHRDLEGMMARNTNDIIGNSKTAGRQIADQQFLGPNMDAALDIGSTVLTGGVPVIPATKIGLAGVKNIVRMGVGKRAAAKAEELAPIMLNPDPAASSASVDDILQRMELRRQFEERQSLRRPLGMFGAGSGLASQNSYSF